MSAATPRTTRRGRPTVANPQCYLNPPIWWVWSFSPLWELSRLILNFWLLIFFFQTEILKLQKKIFRVKFSFLKEEKKCIFFGKIVYIWSFIRPTISTVAFSYTGAICTLVAGKPRSPWSPASILGGGNEQPSGHHMQARQKMCRRMFPEVYSDLLYLGSV